MKPNKNPNHFLRSRFKLLLQPNLNFDNSLEQERLRRFTFGENSSFNNTFISCLSGKTES